jgi:hypothetical protein
MAVISPSSGAVKTPLPEVRDQESAGRESLSATPASAGIQSRNWQSEPRYGSGSLASGLSPSASLPLRFVLTGLLALFVGVAWLAFRPELLAMYHYNQHSIALTHLFTLGWISSIIMGAMYQLVPVALEAKLHSERLAQWQFVMHVIGFVGMVWMFWRWDVKQVGHFASVLGLGVALFVYNIARTLARVPRWDVIAFGVASALVWLSLTALAGLYLTAAKCWTFSPFAPIAQMHAHAHLGAVGFFVMMIVAVSYKLVPMFTLSELQSRRRAGWSIALLDAGLLGVFASILLQSRSKPVFAGVVAGALTLYGWEITAILRARKRRSLDWGLKAFSTAIGLLAPLAVLGLILSWPTLPSNHFTGQLENLYGFLGLFGVVTLAILGMLYKIVPFLVWYARYSREIGRSKVPALADLYSARLQAAGYWTFVAGLVAVSVATVLASEKGVRWSLVLLAGGLVVFGVNMGSILHHLIRPKIEPLSLRPATRTKS